MPIYLNAYPLKIDNTKPIKVAYVDYSNDKLKELREKHNSDCIFHRNGNKIICLSKNENYDFLKTNSENLDFEKKQSFVQHILKEAFKKYIDTIGTNKAFGFNSLSLIGRNDLIKNLISSDFPFSAYPKYSLDIKYLCNRLCLVCDSSTKLYSNQTCKFFLEQGLNLIGKRILEEKETGVRIVIGEIVAICENEIKYRDFDGTEHQIETDKTYIDASNETLLEFLNLKHKSQAKSLREKIRIKLIDYNKGKNKFTEIENIISVFKNKGIITLINGITVEIEDKLNISESIKIMPRPQFMFDNNTVANFPDQAISMYGPYTKRYFDRTNPSICVICSEKNQGSVEQFIRKYLYGMGDKTAYSKGFESKFIIGTAKVQFYTFSESTPAGYKKAIDRALEEKAQENSRWDLAIVQVEDSFTDLKPQENPYFLTKAKLITQNVPVQSFKIELLSQNDYNLSYSLNNMSLASYAKMGGIPWLLCSNKTVAHEIVIGIGCSNIDPQGRIMGITTVFTGSGQYIVSNTSKTVDPKDYKNELSSVLQKTILKLKQELNFLDGDTIRIIFHSTVKKFNKDEIEAIKEVVGEFKQYQIEYAFLKISQNHTLQIFDTGKIAVKKGIYSPTRGQFIHISDNEMLVCLKGDRELKIEDSGHPKSIITDLHPSSTFKDIEYLTRQLYYFSYQSWRSYFPATMPVTILYSDWIAFYLGIFKSIPTWEDSNINNKTGLAKWFL